MLHSGGAVAATLLASCWNATSPATPTTPVPGTDRPSPLPSATAARPSPTGGPPDWSALRSFLKGSLLLPADPGYGQARLLYNTRFDGIRPQAIARCATSADVRECVLFARRHALPLALRSGGHSYGGFSTGPGLVIDTRTMKAVEVRDDAARIAAGAQLIDVYAALAARGAGIPAGSCPSVGITGLTLAGGLGVLSRAWGLTCDNLIEAEIVTADGTVRICDEPRDGDLFWALRGGGGGNFGVVTSLTLRTRAISRLALGFFSWDASAARDVLGAWQGWISSRPVWSNIHLNTGPSPEVAVHATHVGEQSELSAAFDELVRRVGTAPAYREVGSLPYVDAMLLEAGCLGRSVGQCHLTGDTPEGALDRETYAGTSVMLERLLTSEGLEAVTSVFTSRDASAVIIDALGGAVASVAADATAFPHRRALASIQILSSWSRAAPATTADARRASLAKYRDLLRSTIGRSAYVGYVDPDLPDWEAAYYGVNYPRLQRVKAKYDPDNVFTFARAIRAA